jgi:hypothetical protein
VDFSRLDAVLLLVTSPGEEAGPTGALGSPSSRGRQ